MGHQVVSKRVLFVFHREHVPDKRCVDLSGKRCLAAVRISPTAPRAPWVFLRIAENWAFLCWRVWVEVTIDAISHVSTMPCFN